MNLPAEYPFKPAPGTTVTARRAQLEGFFIQVRNLCLHVYKNADGSSLMDYQGTLGNRDAVRQKVLDFELAQGLIVSDGSEVQQPVAAAAETVQPPTPTQQVPMSAPMPVPPAASPAQAANVANSGMPPPVAAAPGPDVAATGVTTKKRPGKANGAAVAPPPAAPPPVPASTAGYMPPQQPPPQQGQMAFAPPSAGGPPPAANGQFQGVQNTQAPAPTFTPPPPPQKAVDPTPAQVATPPVAESTDGPISLSVKALAGQVGSLVEEIGELEHQIVSLKEGEAAGAQKMWDEIKGLKTVQLQILVCLHHMYLTNPTLAPGVPETGKTLDGFQKHLQQFIGSPQ